MIEAVMFAALGFLAAAGLALSLAPVLWRRAERLTRRRIEAVLPLTAAEFRAERDQARADYAVKTRRLEIELDEARRRVVHELAEAGRNAEATTLLKAELQAKSQALADGRRVEIAALVTKVEALKGQVAQLEEAERDAKQRIADLDAARRGATAALAQARERHDDTQRQLAESERRLTEALRRIASIDEDRTRLQTRLAERAAEIPRLEGAAGAHERSEALLATERRARGSGEGLPRAESARPLAPTGTEPDQPTGEDTSRKASAV